MESAESSDCTTPINNTCLYNPYASSERGTFKSYQYQAIGNMPFEFNCECGEWISDRFEDTNPERIATIACDHCGADYAITVTQLGRHEEESFAEQFGVDRKSRPR